MTTISQSKNMERSEKLSDIRSWFMHESGFLEFLMNRLNSRACGADYPHYCESSAVIVTIYLQRRFGLRASVVGGWFNPDKSDGHHYTRVIHDNKTYDICATSQQFTGVDQLLWHESDKGTNGIKYIHEPDDSILSSVDQIWLDKIGDAIYHPDWNRYLDNVIAHCRMIV